MLTISLQEGNNLNQVDCKTTFEINSICPSCFNIKLEYVLPKMFWSYTP